ncbi:MAG: hypothetical protein FI725_06055 [SAR202 cluster bacterium]|nr:hypothetical protein [SAR202 cluster bacterium]
MANHIAEVIESSSTEFVAQAVKLHHPPELGEPVAIKDGKIVTYGLVGYAETTSIEPGRQAISRGTNLTNQSEVYLEHPELTVLLRTTFTAIVTSHRIDNTLYPFLPPFPVKLHSFVYQCDEEETTSLSKDLTFLESLLRNNLPTADEFVAASLRVMAEKNPNPHDFLDSAGQRLAIILRNDTSRLQQIIQRVKMAE